MSWLNSGIDFDLPGNGGPECMAFHSPKRRIFETSVAVGLTFMSLMAGWMSHKSPSSQHAIVSRPTGKMKTLLRILSLSMGIVYLLEVGYKFITLQAVFSLNPCHCLCVIQVFLLEAPNYFNQIPGLARFSSYVFRIHLCFIHGPLVAVFFPVTNTLFLPGEVLVYWLEHALLLTIPFVLLWVYTVPRLSLTEWLNWILMGYGIWGLFHYLFLQPIALWTQANLNSMICPAISDPFSGPYYRFHAIWHQFVGCLIMGFSFYIFGVRENSDSKEKDDLRKRNGYQNGS